MCEIGGVFQARNLIEASAPFPTPCLGPPPPPPEASAPPSGSLLPKKHLHRRWPREASVVPLLPASACWVLSMSPRWYILMPT